jgi:hypothetical protein
MWVKLVSKQGQWFKEGTEVFHYDEDRRITKEEFEEWLKSGIILCRGIRICEHEGELHKVGSEYDDGECCFIEEFDYEYVKENK